MNIGDTAMADAMNQRSLQDLEKTAVHEAGHAVMHVVLSLGFVSVSIKADYEAGVAGYALAQGEFPDDEDADALATHAPEAFQLRHAVALYAGADAVRQRWPDSDWQTGADHDLRQATFRVNDITGNTESIDLLFQLAQRRSRLLVEHYAPEIDAVAKVLLERQELDRESVRKIVWDSTLARRAAMRYW